MGDEGDSSNSHKSISDKQPLHPAYTITNLNNKIRTLDGKKFPYSSWVNYSSFIFVPTRLSIHRQNKPPKESDPSYAAWSELNALILQWIYSTFFMIFWPEFLTTMSRLGRHGLKVKKSLSTKSMLVPPLSSKSLPTLLYHLVPLLMTTVIP
jgi:hypothetical protein